MVLYPPHPPNMKRESRLDSRLLVSTEYLDGHHLGFSEGRAEVILHLLRLRLRHHHRHLLES